MMSKKQREEKGGVGKEEKGKRRSMTELEERREKRGMGKKGNGKERRLEAGCLRQEE